VKETKNINNWEKSGHSLQGQRKKKPKKKFSVASNVAKNSREAKSDLTRRK
jgi:hypothetical protein